LSPAACGDTLHARIALAGKLPVAPKRPVTKDTPIRTNLAKEGEISMKNFQKALDDAGGAGNLPDDQKKLLKQAMMNYATWKDTKGDKAAGKAMLEQGKEAFIADPDFKTFYENY